MSLLYELLFISNSYVVNPRSAQLVSTKYYFTKQEKITLFHLQKKKKSPCFFDIKKSLG